MTAQDRIDALERKHIEDRAKLDMEIAMLRLVPADLQDRDHMAHPSKLWDRIGSLHFRYNRYESIRKGPSPTMADVLRLAEVFPPVDLAVYRDGSVSMRTLEDANRAKEAQDARHVDGESDATVTPIAPFWVVFEAASYSGTMAVHFIGRSELGLIEVKVAFPVYGPEARAIGYVDIKRHGNRDTHMEQFNTITSATMVVTPAANVLRDAKAQTLNFSLSDDRREPGPRYVYWDSCNGEPSTATLADLAEVINK